MQLTSWYRVIQASLPTSRNFMLGVDVGTMPYALRTAFDLLGLTPIKDKLSVDQVVAAFQNHEQTLEDQLGRTADDLIRDLNQFLARQEHVRKSRRANRGEWVIPLQWKVETEKYFHTPRSPVYVTPFPCEAVKELAELVGIDLPVRYGSVRFDDEKNVLGMGSDQNFDLSVRRYGCTLTVIHALGRLPESIDLTSIYRLKVQKAAEEMGIDWQPGQEIPGELMWYMFG